MRKWLKKLFCKHKFRFMRNIHGDEIIERGGKRSIWACECCRTTIARDKYVKPGVLKTCEDYVGLSVAEAFKRKPQRIRLFIEGQSHPLASIAPSTVRVEVDKLDFITKATKL
jgi:hypothetical protein